MFGETPRGNPEEPGPEQNLPPEVIPVPRPPQAEGSLPEAQQEEHPDLMVAPGEETQVPPEAEKPFDYEAEKAAIEARYNERIRRMSEVLKELSLEHKGSFGADFSRVKEKMAMKERYPSSNVGKEPLSESEQQTLILGEKIDKKRDEIVREKAGAMTDLDRRKNEEEKQLQLKREKQIEEI